VQKTSGQYTSQTDTLIDNTQQYNNTVGWRVGVSNSRVRVNLSGQQTQHTDTHSQTAHNDDAHAHTQQRATCLIAVLRHGVTTVPTTSAAFLELGCLVAHQVSGLGLTRARALSSARARARARARTHTHTHTHTSTRAHTLTRTHKHTRAHTHTRARAPTHARAHTRTHTQTDARAHTSTHRHLVLLVIKGALSAYGTCFAVSNQIDETHRLNSHRYPDTSSLPSELLQRYPPFLVVSVPAAPADSVPLRVWTAPWPLQDIVLPSFVHISSILSLPPPTCIARTIAILLHVYCAIYDAPPTPCVCHAPYYIGNCNIV